MDKEGLNFEIERRRFHVVAVNLAAHMLVKAFKHNRRVAQRLGPREFGLVYLSENITPQDPVFEEEVLSKYLELLGQTDGFFSNICV